MKRLTTHELRDSFLDFFAAKGHTRAASDALVPANDPSVLFTSAGMNQFKDHFLGKKTDLSRAVSCQKCFRTGDLEEVGATPFHHTFFEMLGNFSFGDYFKKEAIQWAWEYVTGVLEIDPKDLWVSVYEDDAEALEIWKTTVGLPSDKIRKFGAKDNFWPSDAIQKGPNGPCGPCSEIYYRRTDGSDVEVWNLVFTQFNRQEGGKLVPLPKKNIDTGMGLERMSSVLQGVLSNFETDIFVPILASVEEAVGRVDEYTMRLLADHARAVTFCIGDGVLPSNDGRGYVLRKLIRRCHYHLGADKPLPFLYKAVASVADVMKGPYPEILERRDNIAQIIHVEEEKYIKNILEGGTERANAVISELIDKGAKVMPPEVALDLYETYGIQPSLTKELSVEACIDLDMDAVEIQGKMKRERSRSASKMAGNIFAGGGVVFKPAVFVGFDTLTQKAKVVQVAADGKEVKEAPAGKVLGVVLDRTPFYAEQGGQVGDTGCLKDKAGKVVAKVSATQKQDKAIVQEVYLEEGARLAVGDTVVAEVDAERRQAIRRAHTSTHILQAVLRRVLGEHVQQAGSFVEPDRFRFDFTHFKEIIDEEMEGVQRLLNEYVIRNDTLEAQEMSKDKALKTGAIALFGEKYADKVRVVSIADYSKEFCGGTHLGMTGDIGMILLTNSSSVGSGLRRIEALTGKAAFAAVFGKIETLEEGLSKAHARVKTLEKAEAKARNREDEASMKELLEKAVPEKVQDVFVVSVPLKGYGAGVLRSAVDALKARFAKGHVFIVSSVQEGQAFFACGSNSGISANDLLKHMLKPYGGSGGGRKDFAQGGIKDFTDVDTAVATALTFIKEKSV